MGRRKSHWLFLSLIFVFLMASCLLVSTPQENQNTLETIVATTLTAVASDTSATMPATKTPVVPTFITPRAPQVAYIKDGNVYIWTEGESSVGLTNTGDAVDVRITDDGQVIAYTRRDSDNDIVYELWAVNTSESTNVRLLVVKPNLKL